MSAWNETISPLSLRMHQDASAQAVPKHPVESYSPAEALRRLWLHINASKPQRPANPLFPCVRVVFIALIGCSN